MKVHTGIESIPKITRPVATMGMYDGIHLGHKKILELLNETTKQVGGESVLITFDNHPRLVLQQESDLKLLTSNLIKTEKLATMGLDHLIFIPFTEKFASLSALDFVRDVLVNKLNIHHFLIGHDHHFGKNRGGDFHQLEEYAYMFGFELSQLDPVGVDKTTISSTKIRNALTQGDLSFANKALGEPFTIEGQVIKGDQIGRELGFPTANLQIDSTQLIPKNGVYHVQVLLPNGWQDGMMNIGSRPSVNGSDTRVEVHVFDFSDDLYNQKIQVRFLNRLRDEVHFSSLDKLKEQLEKDKDFIQKNNL